MQKTQLRSSSFASTLSRQDLERYAQEWRFDQEARGHSPRTVQLRSLLTGKLVWFLTKHNYETCGTREMREFFAYLQRVPAHGEERWGNRRLTKAVRPQTLSTYHGHLRTFFRWMVEQEFLEQSPLEKIQAPKVRRDQIQPFTQEEFEALLRAAERSRHPLRDKAIALFLYDTGVRATELCSLRRKDLNLQEMQCRICGKGNKYRTVSIGLHTRKALVRYINEVQQEENEPLFLADRGLNAGEPLTRGGLLQLIERLGKSANIRQKRCSPHTIRHTFAVQFLRAGGNVFTLKEMLGHTDLTMTNRYVAFSQADIQAQHRRFSPADRLGRKDD